MRTLKDNPSIGVFGEIWAKKTCDLIKTVGLTDRVHTFEYTEREALFFDQYDFFIITDFGQNPSDWDDVKFSKLNQMREIIYTRSMRTVMIANDDDSDISASLREAGCRLIRVRNLEWNRIPYKFAELLLVELCGHHPEDTFQKHHTLPSVVEKHTAAA